MSTDKLRSDFPGCYPPENWSSPSLGSRDGCRLEAGEHGRCALCLGVALTARSRRSWNQGDPLQFRLGVVAGHRRCDQGCRA